MMTSIDWVVNTTKETNHLVCNRSSGGALKQTKLFGESKIYKEPV